MPRVTRGKPPTVQPVWAGGAAAAGRLVAVQAVSPHGARGPILPNTK